MDSVSAARAAEVYRKCARAPSLSSAALQRVGQGIFCIHSTWSQRDLEREANIKYSRSHLVTVDGGSGQILDVIDPGTNTELNSEQLVQWSPSGKLRAVLRKVTDKKGDEKQYVEVWDSTHKIHNVNLTAADKHGKVFEDVEFGNLVWSNCETKLLYVAEKKQPKAVSYFEKAKEEGENSGKKEPEMKGDQFLFRQDWGELLVGKHCPVPCILDLQTEKVTVPEGLPLDLSAAQVIWTPDNRGIVFIGLENEPYRLGLIYCRNRKSAVYHLDLSSNTCSVLSVRDQSVRSPAFTPDGSRLIYIRNACHGPHRKCAQLMVYDWKTKETRIAVDIVHTPTEEEPFPGLFLEQFQFDAQSWYSRDILLASTAWRSRKVLVAINISSGKVQRLLPDDEFGSWSFQSFLDGILLAYRSSPNDPGHLVVGKLSGQEQLVCSAWKPLHASSVVLPDISWSIITLTPKSSDQGSDLDFEAILLQPSPDKTSSTTTKLPLIMWPHGGPHSVYAAGYMLFAAAFCQLGYVICLVNYRGSIGFGQASVDSLLGRVGTNDVRDVQLAAEEVVKQGSVDPAKVAICGGSHGGFLATHMIGQYPDFYKVCASRNPVTNIADMRGVTDIPSWTMTEVGIDFEFDKVPTPEMYATMFNASPMAHIDKVKAPTLLMVGASDLRVPPQQGHQFHRMLKARGVKTRLLEYPDNSHPIQKVEAEADCFMNMYVWIAEHLSSS